MNNQEIHDFLSTHGLTKKIFRGVFSSNNRPRIKDGFYVYNTLPRYAPETKMGHWVCFLADGRNITYMDPMGLPELEFEFEGKVQRNEKILQSMLTINCGLYVIYFALSLMRGYTMKQFVSWFSSKDLVENDIFILSVMQLEYEIKKIFE
jgi:hypothetical protein